MEQKEIGTISLNTGSLILESGATIETSTNSKTIGGDIKIDARDYVRISGDSSGIELFEPGFVQDFYTSQLHPSVSNYKISGIYASSKTGVNTGLNIHISSINLTLSNKGKISTSSAGSGKAGNITLNVDHLNLETEASISSNSSYVNTYSFRHLSELQSNIVISGDVVQVLDIGGGKSSCQIYITGSSTTYKFLPIKVVKNMEALYKLSEQYDIPAGTIVKVSDADHAQNISYIYIKDLNFGPGIENWFEYDQMNALSHDDMTHLNQISGVMFDDIENLPAYALNKVIRVSDGGNGKPLTVFCSNIFSSYYEKNIVLVTKLKSYNVSDITNLYKLSNDYEI